MVFLFIPTVSSAYEVLVLKSADIMPYQEALEGFKKTCGCSTAEIFMHELKDSSLRSKIALHKANAIFAIGSDALKEASSIRNIPVVHALAPVIPYAGQEQDNISGVSMTVSAERQLNAIAKVFPRIRKIGCIYDEKNSGAFIKEAQQTAESLGLELVLSKVHSGAEVSSRIEAISRRVELIWMLPDVTVINSATVNQLLLFSFQNNVPIFSFSRKYVEQGAVAALINEPVDIGRQSGELMKSILSSPAERKRIIQSARRPVLFINRKIAAKLGLQISDEIPEGPLDVK